MEMLLRSKYKYVLLVFVVFTVYYLKRYSVYLDWNTKEAVKKHDEAKIYLQTDQAPVDNGLSNKDTTSQTTGNSVRNKELVTKRFNRHGEHNTTAQPTKSTVFPRESQPSFNTLQTKEKGAIASQTAEEEESADGDQSSEEDQEETGGDYLQRVDDNEQPLDVDSKLANEPPRQGQSNNLNDAINQSENLKEQHPPNHSTPTIIQNILKDIVHDEAIVDNKLLKDINKKTDTAVNPNMNISASDKQQTLKAELTAPDDLLTTDQDSGGDLDEDQELSREKGAEGTKLMVNNDNHIDTFLVDDSSSGENNDLLEQDTKLSSEIQKSVTDLRTNTVNENTQNGGKSDASFKHHPLQSQVTSKQIKKKINKDRVQDKETIMQKFHQSAVLNTDDANDVIEGDNDQGEGESVQKLNTNQTLSEKNNNAKTTVISDFGVSKNEKESFLPTNKNIDSITKISNEQMKDESPGNDYMDEDKAKHSLVLAEIVRTGNEEPLIKVKPTSKEHKDSPEEDYVENNLSQNVSSNNETVGQENDSSEVDNNNEILIDNNNDQSLGVGSQPEDVRDLTVECNDSIQSPEQQRSVAPHHCIFHSEYLDSCSIARKYYPQELTTKELKCKSKNYKPICTYIQRPNKNEYRVFCDPGPICGKKRIKVGTFNQNEGQFSYRIARSVKELERIIEIQQDRKSNVAPFVYITCRNVRQLLNFPQMSLENEKTKMKNKEHFNVNIIVIDSLSRQHFYRILPSSVKALKSINDSPESISEVLDFKGLQSLAPFTYVNIYALMNGTIDNKNYSKQTKRSYPVENLFKEFKGKGYRTLLQEDSCWHDRWGSLLTGNEKQTENVGKGQLWRKILDDVKLWGVDDFGLTYMTCEALKKYKITSIFDSHRMLCLNGKPISAYFTDYLLERNTQTITNQPFLSYTHINFGHEKTGRRIRGLDEDLARLIAGLSKQENTVSIIMSDHGGKQSRYSINTLPGRYEVYDSMLFIIAPKTLKQTIGEEAYISFYNNQNSLVSMLDVRETILHLSQLEIGSKTHTKLQTKSLFSKFLSDRRDCQAIGIRKYALCKCMSHVKLVNPNEGEYKNFMMWLAEYAIGQLNNKIADYLLSESQERSRCTRIKGSEIRLVVEEKTNTGVIYNFDVMTTEIGGKRNEVFNFRMMYNSRHNTSLPIIEMNNWNRISIYQKYAFCQDKRVPLELCLCTWDSKFSTDNKTDVSAFEQFGIEPKVTDINNISCLLLLKRDHKNMVSYEVANLCSKKVRILFNAPILYSWQVSHTLPVEYGIEPHMTKFVATFLKTVETMPETFKPVIIAIW